MRLTCLAVVASIAAVGSIPAQAVAQSDANTVNVAVLTDMSGPYSAMGGQGSLVAAKMAIADCLKAECKGMKIGLLYADHQNRADIAATKAREWIDRDHVEAIADLTNSSVALAVQQVIKQKGAIALYSGAATTTLTEKECAPNGFHWMFDTYSQSVGPAMALTKEGFKSWYFLTVDYAFGHSLEHDASELIKQNGGTVTGSVDFPLNAGDLSSFLVQAGGSGAQIIAVAASGQDAVNAVKGAHQFGVGVGKQRLVAMNLFLTDVHSIGLATAQGLTFTDGYYWDFDQGTRDFGARFSNAFHGDEPTMVQAGVYSSLLHFLKARAAAKTSDWHQVVEKMRELPIKDEVMRNASIRPDGTVIHDMYLYQVKAPSESKGPWDLLKLVSTIPASKAFKPEDPSCPLVSGKVASATGQTAANQTRSN